MYLQQDNQHAGQPDRNALLLLRCAYRFLTLSLMVNAPPCPPISVQSHTGKTTREVMSERPDHRDGDALVHELHQGAMYGRQVCYNISLVPYIYTFLPCCPAALPDLPPHPSTPPVTISSAAAARIIPRCKSPSPTRQDHPGACTSAKRGLPCPTGHLTTPSATPHARSAHSPDSECHQHVPTRHSLLPEDAC
jgi:hypothetical protein